MILQVIRWAFKGIDFVRTDASPSDSVKKDGKAEQYTAHVNKAV